MQDIRKTLGEGACSDLKRQLQTELAVANMEQALERALGKVEEPIKLPPNQPHPSGLNREQRRARESELRRELAKAKATAPAG